MIRWNVDPEVLRVGTIAVRWYGLLFLIGFALGTKIVKWMCQREGQDFKRLEPLLIYVVLGTLIGARLGHCLFYEPGYFLSHPTEILKIWNGGLASHGGALGVIFAVWLFTKKTDVPFLWLLDRLSIPAALTSGFVRLGNLMNSEIIGIPTNRPWAFIFEKIDQFPRHPTQIYESVTYFVTFLILLLIYIKRVPRVPHGFLTGLLLISAFASRIGWEFFKESQEPFEASMILNMGQLLSIPLLLIGLILVVRSRVQDAGAYTPIREKIF